MNNENNELLNNDVEIKVSEENIILAPPVELFDEAKEIAQSTLSDEKFPFSLQYDSNQKEFLLSMLEAVGAIVEDDDDDGHVLATMMNMTQIAFIKRLDCVERVKTDEGINPFLAEEANKLTPIQQEDEALDDEVQLAVTDIDPETLEAQTEIALNRITDAALEAVAIAETEQADGDIAVASVTATARNSCCPCPTNVSMETAATISDESYTSGYICCPGAEQWFKFVATRTGQYTICTTGNLDTIGTLYDCGGNQITRVDDYAPCGKINFRIICNLTEGNTYYIKVDISKGDVGSYTLRVTERVFANCVNINKSTITLEKGVTYELPITSNYAYKGYNGAQRIPDLSVSISPSNANEQKIWWWEQYGSVLDCSYGWDDDGDRYIHVTATEVGTAKLYAQDWNENGKRDECTVYVGGAPVTGISLDRTTKTVSLNDTEQVTAIIAPQNALNKGVTWDSSNWNVVDVDSNGVITGLRVGTATISATTDEGGYRATCIVTVDEREKVTVKKDDHSFYVTFADGKVWKNIGIDLSNRQENYNQMYPPNMWYENYEYLIEEEQRYFDNIYVEENSVIANNSYSEKQIGFLYLLDPLGIEYYMRHNACQDMSLGETLFFKDKVYKEIFGVWPRLIKVFPDKSIQYYVYPSSISADTRADYYTDAEIFFGEHPIYDILSLISFLLDVVPSVSLSLFSMFYPPAGVVLGSIELVKFLFFSASASGVLSSGASSVMEEYTSNIYTLSGGESAGVKAGKAMGWVNFVLGTFSAILDAAEVFTPSINDITTYNRINESDYRVNYNVSGSELSMADIISRIS